MRDCTKPSKSYKYFNYNVKLFGLMQRNKDSAKLKCHRNDKVNYEISK